MEKYISSTELRQFIAINAMSNGTHDNEFTETISWLIPKCKELPQTQWQTAEEFASNSVDGWCWIVLEETEEFVHPAYTQETIRIDLGTKVAVESKFVWREVKQNG